MLSEMQLDEYWLEELHIVVAEAVDEDAPVGEYQISTDFGVLKAEEGHFFQVPFTVRIRPDPEADIKPRFERVVVSLRGFFSFPDDTSEDMVHRLVPANCLAILYGIMRGIVAQATGSTKQGAFLLPTLNIVEMVRQKAEEFQAADSDDLEDKPEE